MNLLDENLETVVQKGGMHPMYYIGQLGASLAVLPTSEYRKLGNGMLVMENYNTMLKRTVLSVLCAAALLFTGAACTRRTAQP